MKVFAIYDSKVKAFMPPFMCNFVGEAERAVQNNVNDPVNGGNLFKYPEDFTLMELGEWDNVLGKYNLHLTPVSICMAASLKTAAVAPPQGGLR